MQLEDVVSQPLPSQPRKQRLELVWVNKDIRPRLEPRILIEDRERSYRREEGDNRLIFGDNLLALRALEHEFAGKVKCCFIDPPYNTGSAFAHYDDGLEHSIWLSLMRDRLEIIQRLLSADGSLWISIDDNEAHYLKVLCDEVFGRRNFIANVVWQKKFSPQNDAKYISAQHDHLIAFAKDRDRLVLNRIIRQDRVDRSINPDGDPRGPWKSVDYTCNKSRQERPNLFYPITNPNTSTQHYPKETAVWRFSPERHGENVRQNLVYWGKDGRNAVPRFKKFEKGPYAGDITTSIWLQSEVGNTQEARKEQNALNPSDPFTTPKPERLIKRVLDIATGPGDLVLDSFAGSGTTGAVAHKMGRRWIMVERGEHCHSHILPRLKKVVDGSDSGGVTRATDWRGGGGFRYFRLAPSLLERDVHGREIISRSYDQRMLIEALCKLEGFTYAPSETVYWQHGHSTERDFIFVMPRVLLPEELVHLSEDVGADRSLLVMCLAFRGESSAFPNLTIRKIPAHFAARCEWGRDDYDLPSGLANS